MVNKRLEARKLLRKQDKEWAIAVKAKYKNRCTVCHKKERLNAHHIIPRQNKEFRHDIRNGIALCPKHHRFSFYISAHQNPFIFYYIFAIENRAAFKDLNKMLKGSMWNKTND